MLARLRVILSAAPTYILLVAFIVRAILEEVAQVAGLPSWVAAGGAALLRGQDRVVAGAGREDAFDHAEDDNCLPLHLADERERPGEDAFAELADAAEGRGEGFFKGDREGASRDDGIQGGGKRRAE